MARDKTPKIATQPNTDKTPKAEHINYKNMYPAWRVADLDLSGDWGYSSVSNIIRFSISADLYNHLDSTEDLELYDVLDDLSKKKDLTFGHFLNKIGQKGISYSSVALCKSKDCFDRSYYIDNLHTKLSEFESKTWDAIEKETYGTASGNKSKHHGIKICDLSPKAQKRLKELKLDDIDEVFSLRLEGKLRIIGIRKLNCLSILWIDREHEVCISNKKNT